MCPSTQGGGLSFSIDVAGATKKGARSADEPLHLLIAADCSGRSARRLHEPLAGRRVRRVDVGRLEAVFGAWGAEVLLRLPSGQAVTLAPRELEELHPEQLLQNVAELAQLIELRDALDTDPGAAARLASLLARPTSAAPAAAGVPAGSSNATPAVTGAGESGEDTLSRLLGAAPAAPRGPSTPAAGPRSGVDISGFIRSVVADSAPGAPSTGSAALRAAADLELGHALRALLSDPAFRSLEATWRGIDGLCRNCPDEERVRYSVVDAATAELSAHPSAVAALLEAERPSVLLVDHYFTASADDLQGLARLLSVCAEHDTALITGAHPGLAGCSHFAELADPGDEPLVWSEGAQAAWAEVTRLRSTGARLGLALPRFLLRQPYGKAGEPIEPLAFEELLDQNDHEAFAWGNGAYLLARALAVVHAGAGGVHPDGSVDLRELPVVHLESDEGIRLKPCAEAWLSERAVGRLRAAGFSVLQGLRDTDRIRAHL